MPVTSVTSDPQALTMTLVAEFPVTVERLWRAFTEPAQLERFWGPPGWPATFTRHDFSVGGGADYHMTSPEGQRSAGRWEFLAIEPTSSFEVTDAFVTADGDVNPDLPSMRMSFLFDETATGSRVTNITYFDSLEALEQVVAMGAVEGSTLAINQLDTVLQGLRDFAAGKGTQVQILSDTHVIFTRLIEAPREVVWKAYTTPELVQRWLLGPDGWTMPICEIDLSSGGEYRFGWAPADGTDGEPFGFDGTTLLVEAPRRWVCTEHMTGTEYAATTNDLTLTEEDGATLLSILVVYPDAQVRDMVLATGMTDGMEASYARLEAMLV